jgi:hypothetical protein
MTCRFWQLATGNWQLVTGNSPHLALLAQRLQLVRPAGGGGADPD